MSLCNPLIHLARPEAVGPQVVKLDGNAPVAQGLVDNLDPRIIPTSVSLTASFSTPGLITLQLKKTPMNTCMIPTLDYQQLWNNLSRNK